ncbi:MAG: efflux RND transporter periplasmic adaptor subunit [Flavobacteriales bacterium]|nr:efflux RND transporter periplasmic adaptor subunit [Flavobacteriales bacterium]
MKRHIPSIPFLAALLMAGCGAPAPQEENHSAHADEHAHDDEVVLDSAQMATLGITTVTAQMREMEGHLRLTGRVMASPVSKAQLTSPIGAKVVAVMVDEGDHVRKGQPLVALTDMAFIRMQEEYLTVAAESKRTAAELERQRTLMEGEATARKTLEQAGSDAAQLDARRNSLAAQLRLMGADPDRLAQDGIAERFTLRSPIDGRVNGIRVFLDGRVEPTTVLLEVIDLDHFHVHLNAYERDLALLKEGVEFDFHVMNLPGRTFRGDIFSIGRTFDADGRSIPVHAHVEEGSEQLVEGMSVAAMIPAGGAELLAVPDAAMQRSGDMGYLFLLLDDTPGHTVFQRIPVVPGVSRGGWTAFTPDGPIPQGALFAAGGVFYLWSMLEGADGHDH